MGNSQSVSTPSSHEEGSEHIQQQQIRPPAYNHSATQHTYQNQSQDPSAAKLECPVKHDGNMKNMPANHQHYLYQQQQQQNKNSASASAAPSECPVKHGGPTAAPGASNNNTVQYNIYGQEVDPKNMMPSLTNQKVYPEQNTSLSVERKKSTIPKGSVNKDGTPVSEEDNSNNNSSWLYPSEQMFYNALKRKAKFDNELIDKEEYIKAVVAIHNGVNERTWKKILKWERTLHGDECKTPKLLRFQGKPRDWSYKAQIKYYMAGYPKPFDRHDWIVDRCGKKQQRYIIDYYYNDEDDKKQQTTKDERIEVNKDGFMVPRKVKIDARPAVDDFEAFMDRVKYSTTHFFSHKKA